MKALAEFTKHFCIFPHPGCIEIFIKHVNQAKFSVSLPEELDGGSGMHNSMMRRVVDSAL
jgi:hypothetical protein